MEHYWGVANSDDITRTRASLLGRMKDWNDQASWQDFFDIYWGLIYGVARKFGLNDAEAQDVVQDTMLAVAKQMPGFKYDPAIGSFKAWLLNLTRWRIADQFRKRGPVVFHKSGETAEGTATVERFPDPNAGDATEAWELDWEKTMLAAAMKRVKTRVDPQKIQIFDFYVNRQWPPEKVAETFKVSVGQVYLVKNRITELLKTEVERLTHTVI